MQILPILKYYKCFILESGRIWSNYKRSQYIISIDGTTEAMRISSTGSVGIGTTPDITFGDLVNDLVNLRALQ